MHSRLTCVNGSPRPALAAWPVRVSVLLLWAAILTPCETAHAVIRNVPNDHATIQQALDVCTSGDVVEVETGIYNEKIIWPADGAPGSPVELRAAQGHTPIIDGTGVPGDNLILIDTRSHLRITGFELRNNLGVSDGSAIRVVGSGTDITIENNLIHDIRGKNAMGITVYANTSVPVDSLIIDGNEIYDCEPEPSEALVLNGNVTNFEVTDNYVHDVNNIAIDFIGGETDIQPDPTLVTRNGVCRGNIVERCGSGFSGGIYVDGGRDIIIENNVVRECDLGIEVAAENAGILTTNVTVRNNVLYDNRVVGIVFGGYNQFVGRADENVFRGNTLYKNATDPNDGIGEIWVQYGDNNIVEHNLVYTRGSSDNGVPNVAVASYNASIGNTFDYNLYFSPDGAGFTEFGLENAYYSGFADWQASGRDVNSVFADPELVDPAAGDFHIGSASPAANAGRPDFTADAGETDLDGSPRVSGPAVDIGADELTCGDSIVDAGEDCDDGNLISGDGCDENCTVTGCGNRVITAGEQCDDGNTEAGDCCDAACSYEADGAACDDGQTCTRLDTCDGAGSCAGAVSPDPLCVAPTRSGGSSLKMKERGDSDQLSWKWGKAPEVSAASLGDPTAADGWTLCVLFDEGTTVSAVATPTAPAGSVWQDKGSRGIAYKQSSGAPDGVRQLLIRPGPAGKAKVKLKARGPALELPTLGQGPDAVIVELHSDTGLCLGATMTAPFQADDPAQFKDKSD